MFTIRVSGLNEFTAAIQEMQARGDAAAKAIVAESVALIEARAKANFQGAHRRGEPHVGGSKPNVVTGMLRRSIGHEPIHRDGLATYSTRTGPRTVYGRRVELGYFGGAGRGRQATRPFPYMGPAVEGAQAGIGLIATRRWGEVL